MRELEILYNIFGRPSEYTFNPEDYLGTRGGLINILGLRHNNLVAAGRVLYNKVQERTNEPLERWAFMYALSKWCAEYTQSSNKPRRLGSYLIDKGTIIHSGNRYYCVPAELSIWPEEKETAHSA